MKSLTTPDFWAAYRALPQSVRKLAQKTFQLWQENPSYPSVRWKPLAPGLWSARVGLKYRALARVRGDTAHWFWIGSHNEFDNVIARLIARR